ncbi:ABC transporter substrate-binding protein [bacterium]|nr:ABC transporter substrate-binding protein [bacterium]
MSNSFIRFLLILFIISFIIITGCSKKDIEGKGRVTVGSKIDTEGALLSQMIILILDENGFKTVDKSGTGPTSVVRKAILSGEIDIYPEYTGNGAFFFNETDSDVWKNPQKGYERVKKLDGENNDIVWLTPSPANNTWAIAITKALSDSKKITSMEDFAKYVNESGYIKLIGSEEFVTSKVALPAFQDAYGFVLKKDQLIIVASGDTAQTEKAASEGTDGVNAAMAYGTDGSISAFNLIVLSDPKGAQPVYEPAPIIRGSVLKKYPEIEKILELVFKKLDLITLQTLNAKIAVEGQNAKDVARNYLASQGFIK